MGATRPSNLAGQAGHPTGFTDQASKQAAPPKEAASAAHSSLPKSRPMKGNGLMAIWLTQPTDMIVDAWPRLTIGLRKQHIPILACLDGPQAG